MKEQDLLELKTDISEAKTEIAVLEGSKKELLKQAKQLYNCNSIQDLEKEITSQQKKKEKIETQLTKGLKELEEEMESLEK